MDSLTVHVWLVALMIVADPEIADHAYAYGAIPPVGVALTAVLAVHTDELEHPPDAVAGTETERLLWYAYPNVTMQLLDVTLNPVASVTVHFTAEVLTGPDTLWDTLMLVVPWPDTMDTPPATTLHVYASGGIPPVTVAAIVTDAVHDPPLVVQEPPTLDGTETAKLSA